jgi:hypothetical protein
MQSYAVQNRVFNIVKYFKNVIDVIKQKLGIIESLDNTKRHLRSLIEAEKSGASDEKKQLTAPSKDLHTGEILYHLDMATRHLDVLVDYTLVLNHAGEVASISSKIQELAQRIRAELEAQRTPYNDPSREEDAKERPLSST